jgi:hypothetical protein
MLGAAWWLRWLTWSLFTAVVLGLTWGLSAPSFRSAWGVGYLVAAGLGVGAVIAALLEPKHRAYTAALAGLGGTQRSLAVRSLGGGDVPTDPAILHAAMQLAGVAAAGRSLGRGMWVLRLVVLALLAVLVVFQIGSGEVTQGVVWTGLGLVLAGGWAWDWYDLRRLRIRFGLLREAARGAAAP